MKKEEVLNWESTVSSFNVITIAHGILFPVYIKALKPTQWCLSFPAPFKSLCELLQWYLFDSSYQWRMSQLLSRHLILEARQLVEPINFTTCLSAWLLILSCTYLCTIHYSLFIICHCIQYSREHYMSLCPPEYFFVSLSACLHQFVFTKICINFRLLIFICL
jgi:hypothetical protein